MQNELIQEILDDVLSGIVDLMDEAEQQNRSHSRVKYGSGSLLYFMQHNMYEPGCFTVVHWYELQRFEGLGVSTEILIDEIEAYFSNLQAQLRLIGERDNRGDLAMCDDRSLPRIRAVHTDEGITLTTD